MMNKKAAYIFFLALIIGLIILIISAVNSAHEPANVGNTQTNTPLNQGNKTYQNNAYGITFEYPAHYFVLEKEVGTSMRGHYQIKLIEDTQSNRQIISGQGSPTEAPTAITFDIYQNNLDKQTLVAWVKNTSESNFKMAVPQNIYASTTLAGNEAIMYSWDGLYRGDSYVFAHKENIVMASVTYMSIEDHIKKDFETIKSTVSLTK